MKRERVPTGANQAQYNVRPSYLRRSCRPSDESQCADSHDGCASAKNSAERLFHEEERVRAVLRAHGEMRLARQFETFTERSHCKHPIGLVQLATNAGRRWAASDLC